MWYDKTGLIGGTHWREEIAGEIGRCHIVLLLVSRPFLTSQFICNVELPLIQARAEKREVIVVPILVGHCDWKAIPFLDLPQMLPGGPTPLVKFMNDAAALDRVQNEIISQVEQQVRKVRAQLKAGVLKSAGTEPAAETNTAIFKAESRAATAARRMHFGKLALALAAVLLMLGIIFWLRPRPPKQAGGGTVATASTNPSTVVASSSQSNVPVVSAGPDSNWIAQSNASNVLVQKMLAESNTVFWRNWLAESNALYLRNWLARSNDQFWRDWIAQSNAQVLRAWIVQSNDLFTSNFLHHSNLVFLQTNRPRWTAFSLIAVGNQHVPPASKDQVVFITSTRGSGEVTPQRWSVEYRDDSVNSSATYVDFSDGEMIKKGETIPVVGGLTKIFTGKPKPFDKSKLKIDSDQLLTIIRGHSQIRALTITSTQMTLRRDGDTPVWEVEVWVERQRPPGDECSIDRIRINAETGKIIDDRLNRDRCR